MMIDSVAVEVGLPVGLEVALLTFEGLVVGVLPPDVALEQVEDAAEVALPVLGALLAVVGVG